MNTRERLEYMVPKIGLRNIKTALAAALCALVYYFLDRSPAFACIGAIFGMGSSYEQSRLHGGNRFFGTLVGGFIGMGLFAIYMELFPDGSNRWFLVPLTFIGVVILILLCQHIWVGGVQPGGVVLCILLFWIPASACWLPFSSTGCCPAALPSDSCTASMSGWVFGTMWWTNFGPRP